MQLTAFPITILCLFAVGVSLVITANIFFYTILGETNDTLPPDQRISIIGVNVKYGRVLRIHAQRFPESKKRKQMKLLFWGGIFFGALAFLIDVIHYGHW